MEILDFLKQRRTIRAYSDREIPQELLDNLLESAFRGSTMGGMQLYSVVVTRDAEMKSRLAPAHFNQPMVTAAPVVLTFCADFNRATKWCEQRKANPGYGNFASFVNAFIDAVIVAQTFCVAAESEGLGICYLGTTTYNPDQIIEVLSLPRLVFPVATITVGYPAECPQQVDRLPLRYLIHDEKYRDYTHEDIDQCYALKESLPENQRFVQENGKQTLAQVFADVRYTKPDNEHFSKVMLEWLRRQGFCG